VIGEKVPDCMSAVTVSVTALGTRDAVGGGGVRAYHDRKRSEGKTHSRAVIAVTRRQFNALWAMLRDHATYQRRSGLKTSISIRYLPERIGARPWPPIARWCRHASTAAVDRDH
jgi:hypothetical protein